MAKVVVITSGKGGVGKTTITANLGAALASQGKRTLLIDTDTGLRNLDLALSLEGEVVYDLTDVLDGSVSIDEAMLKSTVYKNLYFVPTSQTRGKEDVTPEGMTELCESVKERFDYILIDCPAGIEHGFRCALAPADMALVIVTQDKASMRDADRIAGLIESQKPELEQTYMIINRFRSGLAMDGDLPSEQELIFSVKLRMLGIVPEDSRVLIGSYQGKLAISDKKSTARRAFLNISKRMNGENVPLLKLYKKRYRKGY